jgi:hypothetical protein
VNERLALGVLVVAGFIGTIFAARPVFAPTAESFLTIERANASINDDNELKARLIIEGLLIPTNGTEGAFGYGILTDDGDAILVSHTHAGILDSEDQRFIGDPIWHTHFMKLGDVTQCGEDQGVVGITWQSPGVVRINNDTSRISRSDDNTVRISGVPTDEFKGWDSMDGKTLSMTLGKDVSDVVSFKLKPVFGEDGLEAVCVTDIRSAEEDVNID